MGAVPKGVSTNSIRIAIGAQQKIYFTGLESFEAEPHSKFFLASLSDQMTIIDLQTNPLKLFFWRLLCVHICVLVFV